MSAVFYIYILFRPWSGVPCYVGKGKGSRAKCHSNLGPNHYNRHLAAIFKKAGNRELPCVIVHSGLDEETAFSYEIAFIKAIGRANIGKGPLCNLTDGGEGISGAKLPPQSAERRAIASKTHKGKVVSDQTRERLRISHLGYKHSAESRVKMKAASSGHETSEETRAKIGTYFAGKPLSLEHRAKLRASRLGKKASEETKSKMSASLTGRKISDAHRAALTGRKLSDEHKAKISASKRRQAQI